MNPSYFITNFPAHLEQISRILQFITLHIDILKLKYFECKHFYFKKMCLLHKKTKIWK